MDWYPWYPVDYRRDTLRLTLAEDGAYRRLIDEYMILRGPLPDDDRALARLLGISFDEWMTVAPAVRKYFRASAGRLTHKRCNQEIAAQDMKVKRYSDMGRKGAFAKHSKINGFGGLGMTHNITKKERGSASKEVASLVDNHDSVTELQAIVFRKGWAVPK